MLPTDKALRDRKRLGPLESSKTDPVPQPSQKASQPHHSPHPFFAVLGTAVSPSETRAWETGWSMPLV